MPEVVVAETATKPSTALLQRHSFGGCGIDMPPSNQHWRGHIVTPLDQVLYGASDGGLVVAVAVLSTLDGLCALTLAALLLVFRRRRWQLMNVNVRSTSQLHHYHLSTPVCWLTMSDFSRGALYQ